MKGRNRGGERGVGERGTIRSQRHRGDLVIVDAIHDMHDLAVLAVPESEVMVDVA